MHLILFDIDGTLTQTTDVDNRCFVRAALETMGLAAIDTDWASYPDVTDSGIVWRLHEVHRGAPPTEDEIGAVRSRFLELLGAELTADPSLCLPVPGAAELLAQLSTHPDYAVGLATGAWRESAEMKLGCAGLLEPRFPMATGSDARSREAIMLLSRQRVGEHWRRVFDKVTYVGDGVWDARASRQLGYHFVGVGRGERAERLRREGAECVIADYTDPARFFAGILSADARWDLKE